MSELIVKAEKLTKVYKLFAEEITAVDGVDLEISSGELVSIMGLPVPARQLCWT